jgi:hypothetical protein
MRRLLLLSIKTVHTIAFAVIAGSIGVVFVDGVRGRPARRTGAAAAIAIGECAVYAANGFVCPLTPLAERYGAERGSVSDIFLPDVIARNLAWIATPILVAGLVLNARSLLTRRQASNEVQATPNASVFWRRQNRALGAVGQGSVRSG